MAGRVRPSRATGVTEGGGAAVPGPMKLPFGRGRRAVGLDVGSGAVKALCLESRRAEVVVAGRALARVEPDAEPRQVARAIHSALAAAGADGAPVVAAVGGPDVVIRQVSLPPVPPSKILPALELQHRELGLLSPGEAVIDAQVLRRARDGVSNDVLSVSVPRVLIDERLRLLEMAAVSVSVLDVEPLALLNAAIHLTALEPGELLVLLTIGRERSVLCLFSEAGPVVARYLAVGADTLLRTLGASLNLGADATRAFVRALSPEQAPLAEAACRDVVERMAEDVRLSLTFYRTEYDRESAPRYAVGGSLDVPYLTRWIADRLGLDAAPELIDPFKTAPVDAPRTPDGLGAAGPQFVQAFGLALRAL
jgi:type IV pilus assembly protein PilM